MGCGSSSLKGDDVPNVNSQPVTTSPPGVQPIRKVRTNFSDVDYDQDTRNRRMTEYAPHETPAPIREQSYDASADQQEIYEYSQQQQYANDDIAPGQPNYNAGTLTGYPHEGTRASATAADHDPNTTLKPYQTLDGGDWDNNDNANQHRQAQPYVNGTQDSRDQDPTSTYAKDEFASANDPANPHNQEPHQGQNHQAHHARQAASDRDQSDPNYGANHDDPDFYTPNADFNDPEQPEHKKSWLGQKYASFQSAKRGSGPSDEDVLKYTGKDRDELNEWARDRPGVGGNQEPGQVGAGASWN